VAKVNQPILTVAPKPESVTPITEPLWRGLIWVMALGFGLRLTMVFLSEDTIHPDEVFQYLEQAHRLVFGYGIVPWEYVHGIRSWLLPMILAFPLWITHRLGVNDPHLYIPIIQILAAWISLSAIFCTYWIGRRLYSESVGRIAAVFTAAWWEMVFWGHKATPEIFSMYLLLGAFACLVSRPSRWVTLLFGLCCAGTVAFRLQYAPPVAILVAIALIYVWQRKWSLNHMLMAAIGLLAGVGLVGWLDYYTWGGWWISYANNYLYNRVYGVSSIWGEHPISFYPLELGKNSAGLFWIAISVCLAFKPGKTWLPLALIASIVLPHTLIPHKEYRFITAVIPLCLLLVAVILNDLLLHARSTPRGRPWRKALALGLMAYPLIGIFSLFAFMKQDADLRAYLYLHDQPAMTSLLNLSKAWFATGGYYYLHQDIPIYYADQVAELAPTQWARYFSHIISPADQPQVPGFTAIAQIGNLTIQAATDPPTDRLAGASRVPPQGGIDGVYSPRVVPRFSPPQK